MLHVLLRFQSGKALRTCEKRGVRAQPWDQLRQSQPAALAQPIPLRTAKRMELTRRNVCLVTDPTLQREVRESAHRRSSHQGVTYQPWKSFYFVVFRMQQSALAHVRFKLSPSGGPAAPAFHPGRTSRVCLRRWEWLNSASSPSSFPSRIFLLTANQTPAASRQGPREEEGRQKATSAEDVNCRVPLSLQKPHQNDTSDL